MSPSLIAVAQLILDAGKVVNYLRSNNTREVKRVGAFFEKAKKSDRDITLRMLADVESCLDELEDENYNIGNFRQELSALKDGIKAQL